MVAVLGLGEAGGRLAADLVSAGVEVRGYDPVTGSGSGGRRPGRRPRLGGLREHGRARPDDRVDRARRGRVGAAGPARRRDLRRPEHDVTCAEARRSPRSSPEPAHGSRTSRCSDRSRHAGSERRRWRRAPARRRSRRCSDPSACRSRSCRTVPVTPRPCKLLRSVFMKGLAASALESLRAAEAAGHASWLEGEIAAVIGEPLLERLVEGSRRHAVRRVDEMEAARELLLELGVEPRIAAASAAVLAELAAGEPTAATGCARDDAAGCGDVTERASARARGGCVRPARPRRSGRASAADRRPHARAAFRRARARRVRPQVALHVHRRARAGRLGARPGGARSSAR